MRTRENFLFRFVLIVFILVLFSCSSVPVFDSATIESVAKAWYEDEDTIMARGAAASKPEGSLAKKEANAREGARLVGQRQMIRLCLGYDAANESADKTTVKERPLNKNLQKLYTAVRVSKSYCGKDKRNDQVIICEVISVVESENIRQECRETNR